MIKIYLDYNNDSSNKSRIKNNEDIDIFDKELKKPITFKTRKTKKKYSVRLNNNSLNKNKLLINVNNILNNDNGISRKKDHSLTYKKMNMKNDIDSQSYSNLNFNVNNNCLNKDKNIIETHESKDSNNNNNNKNRKIRFTQYLAYLFTFQKCQPNVQFITDFRIKMISEENIILTKLNLDKMQNKNNNENSHNKQNFENIIKLNYNN